jgi:type I restriction enzyme S subunit
VSSELPKNWVVCEIGDVAKVVGGSTPPSKDLTNFTAQGGTPWITPADLSGYKNIYISQGARNLSDKGFAACSAAKMPPGSVLFSSRAPVGYVAIASNEVTTNQGFKSFVLPDSIDSRFVYYYLRHIKPVAEMMATGTTFKELSGSAAAKLPFVLAPLNEQKRIADKLDSLLARVDACRERLDRVPQVLKRFRQAVLAAATSGVLTEEWRVENPLPKGLVKKELFDLIECRRSSSKGKFKDPAEADLTHWSTELPDCWETGSVSAFAECLDSKRIPVTRESRNNTDGIYPYYGANGLVDMVNEYIFDDELVLVTEDETFYGRVKPIAYRSSGKCWVNNHAHVLRASNKASADYLCYCLMYYHVIPWLTGTTGRAKLTQAVLNVLPIGVPPQQEINEIVRRVETLFAFADRLEARYTAARSQVDQLTPSLLAKAFRGELVPQDPNDEQADKLLERIKAAKPAPDVKPKRGRQKGART